MRGVWRVVHCHMVIGLGTEGEGLGRVVFKKSSRSRWVHIDMVQYSLSVADVARRVAV